MMMRNALFLMAALTVFGLSSPLAARAGEDEQSPKWLVDLEKAKQIAAKEKLDILMEFTGSDWCPPCIKLHKNVLTKDAFQKTAPKHFVLLKLDNPRDKSKQSKEEIQQYQDLSKKFNVTGVPTIILTDATGKPYAKQVGYGGQSAEDFTEGLVKKVAVRKERDEFLAKAKNAKGVERAELLAKALKGIDSELVLTEYRDTVDEIVKLDANDEAKLKSKFENLTRLSDINKQLNQIQLKNRGKAEEGVKQVEELITKEKLTGEPLQSALFVKGAMLFTKDKQASRKALEQAVEAAPESARAAQIRSILERYFKEEKKDKDKD